MRMSQWYPCSEFLKLPVRGSFWDAMKESLSLFLMNYLILLLWSMVSSSAMFRERTSTLPRNNLQRSSSCQTDFISFARFPDGNAAQWLIQFSILGTPISSPNCLKKDLKVEFRLLVDLVSKCPLVEARAFNKVTTKKVMMMATIASNKMSTGQIYCSIYLLQWLREEFNPMDMLFHLLYALTIQDKSD